MSADNGIYILRTLTDKPNEFEYRVAHLQAIENLFYYNENEIYMFDSWGKSSVYFTEIDAFQCAIEIQRRKCEIQIQKYITGYIEYGISVIPINKSFPKERPHDLGDD